MNDSAHPRLIETEIGRSPDRPRARDGWGLPDDLLSEATQRLRVACLVGAVAYACGIFIVYVLAPRLVPADAIEVLPRWQLLYTIIAAVNIPLCMGFFWYTKHSKRSPRFLLDLGLGLYLVSALSTGLVDYGIMPWSSVSWMPILILLWPGVVPTPPSKTLVMSLVAASLDPASALIWKTAGAEVPGTGRVILQAIPNFMAAGLAVVISHVVTRLGRKVHEAREMGSYVLGRLIGRGGMGEVWQATHRLLVRPAAIKLIRPEMLGQEMGQAEIVVERFRREARAAASLRSPHTVQLYDFGVSRDGTFYYVMELLNGLDLQTLISEHGPVPPARAIHLLRQTCESLGEAHDRGLVHRDIKPANVQVCQLGREFDFVKLLDFGLVKGQRSEGLAEAGLTAPNVVAGTPSFMSPESALGRAVDHRADLYSLGCVAYWMLTGRLVFTGQSAIQMIVQHVEAVPDPPSRWSPLPVPPDFDAIVISCLAKDPANRPGTAWELADRLAQCRVEPAWTPDDARQWWQACRLPESA